MSLMGDWSFKEISFEIPKEILQDILRVPRSPIDNLEDDLVWSSSPDRKFSTKSTHKLIRELNGTETNKDWG